MRKVKKYANGKLYDTIDKRYLSKSRLSEMLKTGEEIVIVDVKTEEDITSEILKDILPADEHVDNEEDAPSNILIDRLKKGRETVSGYGKKYVSMWQSVLSMAEEEVDKLVKKLIKDKEITESEGAGLKKEILGYKNNLKSWINDKIDQRVNDVLGLMNLATKEQVAGLTEKIGELNSKIGELEARQSEQEKQARQAKKQEAKADSETSESTEPKGTAKEAS